MALRPSADGRSGGGLGGHAGELAGHRARYPPVERSGPLSARAYRIVTNKTNDWIKRKSKHPLPQTDEDLDGSAQDPRQANETAADLQAILHRLSKRSRTVLTLHYLEQFDVAEIARILHVPAGTVKSRLHTARAEFKKHWQAANNAPTLREGAMK